MRFSAKLFPKSLVENLAAWQCSHLRWPFSTEQIIGRSPQHFANFIKRRFFETNSSFREGLTLQTVINLLRYLKEKTRNKYSKAA